MRGVFFIKFKSLGALLMHYCIPFFGFICHSRIRLDQNVNGDKIALAKRGKYRGYECRYEKNIQGSKWFRKHGQFSWGWCDY